MTSPARGDWDVDWAIAARTGRRLIHPGPEVSAAEARAAVNELAECAERAHELVRRTAELDVRGVTTSPTLVTGRRGWIGANVESMRGLIGAEPGRATRSSPTGLAAGVQLGALLSWMGTKVLGQYDPFHVGSDGDGREVGRLLLVAPNVVRAERDIEAVTSDFRLWVCLHEETHRVQFGHTGWLVDYLRDLATELINDPELTNAGVTDLIRQARRDVPTGQRSLVDLLPSDRARTTIDRITAVMSLLEGHADVVMDRVGPEVIGTVAQIRRRFDRRRESSGLDKVLRRVLGMDLKMAQYRDGAKFCRTVIDRSSMTTFNRVWTSPNTLPTLAEIHRPELWLDRLGWQPPRAESPESPSRPGV